MKRDPVADRFLLNHILQCIENVEQDLQGQRERLTKNRTIRDPVLRNLQIMAESTQRLSDATKKSAAEIPWKQLEGFRHRLVHDYFETNLEIVWGIVEQHLPILKAAAKRILAG